MRTISWILGAASLVAVVCWLMVYPPPLDLGPGAHYAPFVTRAFYIILLAGFLCLFRVLRGPTPADRLVAIDIFGILIVGCCAIFAVGTGQSWYIDIGITWALMSFIGALALAKYLEGRPLDD
ncbi:MAG TPA: cation:proton antiporter [Candidatus Hydrogenedentes bacterium]|nr:cation:proton antiporter [Candidatus Hydrogenedentota bacterium]HQH53551.1 cation:proton antiporter [Candidatus Hydrogenedentota bacterium]